jgi:hypothetical protein
VAASVPAESSRIAGDWLLAKNSRTSAKTTMPRISVATPMLLRIESRRTPYALMSVVTTSVMSEMNVNIDVRPVGSGVSRNAVSPTGPWIPSMTNATMTATAVTVTTWAQK